MVYRSNLNINGIAAIEELIEELNGIIRRTRLLDDSRNRKRYELKEEAEDLKR